jgi:hypothetical protein
VGINVSERYSPLLEVAIIWDEGAMPELSTRGVDCYLSGIRAPKVTVLFLERGPRIGFPTLDKTTSRWRAGGVWESESRTAGEQLKPVVGNGPAIKEFFEQCLLLAV